jgi:hypothetical protein
MNPQEQKTFTAWVRRRLAYRYLAPVLDPPEVDWGEFFSVERFRPATEESRYGWFGEIRRALPDISLVNPCKLPT